MRILLVTLQGANIGNRLQNYALQEVLKKLHHEIFTPYYYIPEQDSIAKRFKIFIKVLLAKLGVKKFYNDLYLKKRQKIFAEFDKSYIDNRFRIKFETVSDEFDKAITGSDQVWHKWSENSNELDYFYLQFMPSEKRISYAASFGFNTFPEKDIKKHIKGLSGIKYLSCREEVGKKLINNLVGKEAKITLDPTLLLDKNEWNKIARKPKYKAENYILVYFLGNETGEYLSGIRKLAKENNLMIIDVLDYKNPNYFFTSPDEFVWLIKNASFVCTDSFHACVFSIIYHRKFLAFKRQEVGMNNMFDRIENLFKEFGIEREYEGDISKIYLEYGEGDIGNLLDDSINFLVDALNNR